MLCNREKSNSLVLLGALRKELNNPSDGSGGLGHDKSPAAVVAGWSLALAQRPPSCYCSLLHLAFDSWPSSCTEPSPLSFPFPLELWVHKKFAFPAWHLLFCHKKNVRYLPRFEAGQLALGKNSSGAL